ncbi:hypothetical protein [Bacteroides nordii]|uniref:hypothetical protein n=1 Tax=Bacteroides nordii TaxID=291645 RepID=UPI0018A9B386|nr:hypothetical protein [Bacteroides nordii]
MKHIYTFLLLAMLGLSMASCSDDKRDIVFFTGDAPIYQTGTCANLISSVSLYPIKPEGEIIGIDGGNGDYSIIGNTDEAVVAVVMTVSEKYKRLQITPKTLGEATIIISDGDGKTAALKVKVREYGKRMVVNAQGIIVNGEVTDEKKAEIADGMKETFPVAINGGFELVSGKSETWKDEGILRVYHENFKETPVIGSYSWKLIMVNDKEKMGFSFIFDDKEYQFTTSIREEPKTRSNNTNVLQLYEDVTSQCTVECPVGTRVYRGYKIYLEDL